MAWATVEQLADLIGRDADTRMPLDLAAALAWARRRRKDLDPAASPPELTDLGEPGDQYVVTVSYDGVATAVPVTPDTPSDQITVSWAVNRAVLLFAAHLWWSRANPTGTPAAYGELADGATDAGDMLEQAYRLLGKPKARAR